MIFEIILGLVIAAAVIIIVILLFFLKRPYKWNKEIKGEAAILTFEARTDIKGIELVGVLGNEKIDLQRKNIKKGEKIEFNYPASTEKVVLIIETDGGRKKHEL